MNRQHLWAEAWMVAWRSRAEALPALCLALCLEVEVFDLCYWRSAWMVGRRCVLKGRVAPLLALVVEPKRKISVFYMPLQARQAWGRKKNSHLR